MDGVCELRKFNADLSDDMSEEEDGDLTAAVEPPTRKQRRGDLPKKSLLKTILSEAVEAGVKAAADTGEQDMVGCACRTSRPLKKLCGPGPAYDCDGEPGSPVWMTRSRWSDVPYWSEYSTKVCGSVVVGIRGMKR